MRCLNCLSGWPVRIDFEDHEKSVIITWACSHCGHSWKAVYRLACIVPDKVKE
jgi:hypothetical protein